jgi:hypothetical protein
VTDVLAMPACQYRDPVAVFVGVEGNDLSVGHDD